MSMTGINARALPDTRGHHRQLKSIKNLGLPWRIEQDNDVCDFLLLTIENVWRKHENKEFLKVLQKKVPSSTVETQFINFAQTGIHVYFFEHVRSKQVLFCAASA